jgi:hypothetical protein
MKSHAPHVALVAMLRALQHENLRQRLAHNGVSSEHLTFREAERSDLLRFDGVIVVATVGGHTAINAVRQRCDDTQRPCILVDHKASAWPWERIRSLPIIRNLDAPRREEPPFLAEDAAAILPKGIVSFGDCLRAARESNNLDYDTLAELMSLAHEPVAAARHCASWESDASSPTREEHALLLELFPALKFAPLPAWPVATDDGLEGDEWVTSSLTIARPSSSLDTPEPEVPMPPPAPQLDKSDVIKLATLTATARSTLPDGVRDLLLTAQRLNFTLQDVLDLLAIQEHS